MWLLNNMTPFEADRTWVRDPNGAEVWIVAVKGTFLIESDGHQVLDENQAPIARVPEFSGEPGLSSLLCESDFVHKKAQTDVILQGHAYCPRGEPTANVDVRLKVANINKTLRVTGDRQIDRGFMGLGVSLSTPKPFTRMPITYERSFGGTDQKSKDLKRHRWEPRNPVGVGFATRKEHVVGNLAPNIEWPDHPYSGWRTGQPAGFGPIARHWSPRLELAGTYDKSWEKSRSPLLPSDFDERFYQCAPRDQQTTGFLKGGEQVELYNLTPEGYLAFHLPRITLGMTTRFYDGTTAMHRAYLHTLVLLPDQRKFVLVWHSNLPCHDKEDKLEVTDITLKRRLRVSYAEMDSGVWMG